MTTIEASFRSFLLLLAAVLAAPAMAHQGHDHDPITREEATKIASIQIERLVSAGKLESSWKTKATLQSAEVRPNGKAKEWALVYTNAEVADAGKKTLYVFLSETGKYLSAGHSGR